MSGRLCLIHHLTDCSPLLNGCSWLTDPGTPVRVAQKHVDAIADTGDGYEVIKTASNRWAVGCLWCDWRSVQRIKREAIAAYRLHERRMIAELGPVDAT